MAVTERPAEFVSVVSAPIAEEWLSSLNRKSVLDYMRRKNARPEEFARIVAGLIFHSQMVVPAGEAPYCRDPKDRMYLHCCVAGEVDVLISTDRDLLDLKTVESTLILGPYEAWAQLLFE